MCGRYTLKTPVEQLSEKFQFPEVIPLKPRYNIAPSQAVAVVRLLPDDTDRKLAMLRWGLLPAWVKDPAKVQQPINAKAETAAEKPLLRPYPPETMTYYPVNLRVNNPRNDDVLCIEPLPQTRIPPG